MKNGFILAIILLFTFIGCSTQPTKEEIIEKFKNGSRMTPYSESFRGIVVSVGSRENEKSICPYLVRMEGKAEYKPSFGWDANENLAEGDLITIYVFKFSIPRKKYFWEFIIPYEGEETSETLFISKNSYLSFDFREE